MIAVDPLDTIAPTEPGIAWGSVPQGRNADVDFQNAAMYAQDPFIPDGGILGGTSG